MTNAWQQEADWHEKMRAHLANKPASRPMCSEFPHHSPFPSLQRMLTALYEAEVDFAIHSAWDAGFRLAVHHVRGDGVEHRGFTVGKGAHDYPDWTTVWEAAVLFICEAVVRDWDNLEDGAPVDIGCLDCTMNTTPVDLTRGECVYHIARHVLKAHGIQKDTR